MQDKPTTAELIAWADKEALVNWGVAQDVPGEDMHFYEKQEFYQAIASRLRKLERLEKAAWWLSKVAGEAASLLRSATVGFGPPFADDLNRVCINLGIENASTKRALAEEE